MLLPTYPIATARLDLRPFEPDDLQALHAIESRPDVARYLYRGPRLRDETARSLAQRIRQRAIVAEGDKLILAMVLRAESRLVGDVTLAWLSETHARGEIGFILHPDFQGRGLAREAAETMLRLGFEGLGLHRIIGRCDARNTASARLMERLGMAREAHFRQNEHVKGEWTDEYVYALRADDWRTHDDRRTEPSAQ